MVQAENCRSETRENVSDKLIYLDKGWNGGTAESNSAVFTGYPKQITL